MPDGTKLRNRFFASIITAGNFKEFYSLKNYPVPGFLNQPVEIHADVPLCVYNTSLQSTVPIPHTAGRVLSGHGFGFNHIGLVLDDPAGLFVKLKSTQHGLTARAMRLWNDEIADEKYYPRSPLFDAHLTGEILKNDRLFFQPLSDFLAKIYFETVRKIGESKKNITLRDVLFYLSDFCGINLNQAGFQESLLMEDFECASGGN